MLRWPVAGVFTKSWRGEERASPNWSRHRLSRLRMPAVSPVSSVCSTVASMIDSAVVLIRASRSVIIPVSSPAYGATPPVPHRRTQVDRRVPHQAHHPAVGRERVADEGTAVTSIGDFRGLH